MRLWLVRHPPTLAAPGLCYGSSDVACDAQVLREAAARLAFELPQGLPLICSPLQRCELLAQYLCGLRPDLVLKIDARIAEMHFGGWEMCAWDAIARDALAAWSDDFAHYRCGGSGESSFLFVRRVATRLAQSMQAGQDEIWITHAGVMRALLWLQRQCASPAALIALLKQLQQAAPEGRCPCPLLAHDWPRDELAFGRVSPWDCPESHWR